MNAVTRVAGEVLPNDMGYAVERNLLPSNQSPGRRCDRGIRAVNGGL